MAAPKQSLSSAAIRRGSGVDLLPSSPCCSRFGGTPAESEPRFHSAGVGGSGGVRGGALHRDFKKNHTLRRECEPVGNVFLFFGFF